MGAYERICQHTGQVGSAAASARCAFHRDGPDGGFAAFRSGKTEPTADGCRNCPPADGLFAFCVPARQLRHRQLSTDTGGFDSKRRYSVPSALAMLCLFGSIFCSAPGASRLESQTLHDRHRDSGCHPSGCGSASGRNLYQRGGWYDTAVQSENGRPVPRVDGGAPCRRTKALGISGRNGRGPGRPPSGPHAPVRDLAVFQRHHCH